MDERIDTVIIGAGQAGLAVSFGLTQRGCEHVILEQARVGESWRNGRWDSFSLVTPNWLCQLPGYAYRGDDPDGFLVRAQIVEYLEGYAASFVAPLRCGVHVESVEPVVGGSGYLLQTNAGTLGTRNVVVAVGLFQKPKRPPIRGDLPPDIVQIPSGAYRNPQALPSGAVLVIGSAQAGAQIAEELNQSGRKVYLCVSGAGRIPRRYRGRDTTAWLNDLGWFDRTPDKLPTPKARFGPNPHVSGKGPRGHTLNLHRFARDGISLLGHLEAVEGGTLVLAPNLYENLGRADRADADIRRMVDEYVARTGVPAPLEEADRGPELRDGYDLPQTTALDLRATGITTIISAIGYQFDFGWVHIPVYDQDGYPIQQRGVTSFPGMYFVGLPWLYRMKSGLLCGVGPDATYIAEHIAGRERH